MLKIGKTIGKSVIDLGETLVITGIIDAEFWQELIISIVVIIFNFLIIPLIKALFKKIKEKWNVDLPDVPDVKDDDFKKDNKDKEEDK